MKHIISILFCILVVSTAWAGKPKVFLGPNLHLNFPTGDFAGTDPSLEQGGAKTGWGGEGDIGVLFGGTAIYAGYLYDSHQASVESSMPFYGSFKANGEWTIRRYVLGLRVPLLSADLPVKPALGMGLTIGKTKANPTLVAFNGDEMDINEVSSRSVGWFLEGGILVRLNKIADFMGGVQYQEFDASFGSMRVDTPYGSATVSPTFRISYIMFKAGLVYRL